MSLPHAPASGRRHSAAHLATALVCAMVCAMTAVALGPAPQASAAPATLSHVGAASSAGLRKVHTLRVPARVVAGDTLVLFLATNSPRGSITSPAGWRLMQSRDGATTKGRLWTRTASAADRNTVVTVRSSVSVRSTLSLSAYRSSAARSLVTASAATVSNVSAGTHVAPALPVSQAGSWLVNLYGGKNSASTVWTNPTGTVRRTGAATSGSGRMTAIVVDSNKAVPTGAAASRVARTNKSLTGRQLYTLAISPGTAPVPPPPPANRAPVAAFTASCAALTCSFDATGSTDADGDPLTYSWAFGDTTNGTGATTAHTYPGTGTRNVTLTVGDAKSTTTLTKPVTATYAEPLPGHTKLVPETPRTDLPKISDGEINDLEVVGSRVYVAGTFTGIANQRGGDTTSYNQRFLAAYDLETGLVDADFDPTFAGPSGFAVEAVEASPDGTRLYVAGGFNTVNGVTRKGLVRLDPSTGDTVAGFTADTDARSTEIAVTDSTVYVGGRFGKVSDDTGKSTVRTSLAAVDALTGTVDPGFVNNLSGGIGVNGGLAVQKLLLTHDGSKLVVVHTGKQVNGQDRYGIALISTATKQLLPWRTRLWDENLQFVGGVQRIITGSIAPDDSYFVVSSGSGGDRPPINDTVVAYDFTGGDDVQPKWVSRAFDSVYATAVSETAVYIGGHFAWNESPSAPDPWPGAADIGYGTGQGLSGYGLGDSVVNREHLGALNPVDGKALEWNPGSNSNFGNTAMALTPRGLITGGDATTQGGFNVGRVAVFDFDAPAPAPNGVETTITKPISGRVLGAGTEFTIEGTATAPTGVRKVFIEVQNRGTQQWLQADRTTWGGAANLEATVTPLTATTAEWSLNLVVPGNLKMLARAKAQGMGDAPRPEAPTKAIKKFETFGLDDAPPTMTYTAPAAGLVTSQTFTIQGTTADDRGVTGISMTLKNAAGGYLQDDGSVDATYNAIGITPDVPNATSTTWSKEITVPTEGTWSAQARARDTGGNASLDTTDRTWNVSADGHAPSVSISSPGTVVPPTAPQPVTVEPGGPMTFTGSATDDGKVKSIQVALRNNSTGECLTVDGTWGIDNGLSLYKLPVVVNQQSYNWSWTTPQDLTPGNYTFAVLAVDDEGITTPQSSWAVMTMNAVVTGDVPPKATLTRTGVQPPSGNLALEVDGQATDDHGVDEVRLIVKDLDTSRYLKADGTVSAAYTTVPADVADAGATSTGWAASLTLPNQGNWNLTAYAVDTVGQRDLATTGATASYRVYPGDSAPTLTENLLAPTEGASFTEGRIFVSGRAEDDQATAKVEVAILNASNQHLTSSGGFGSAESWRATFLTSPGTAGSNFSYTTPVLPAGSYTVRVRAIDQHGLVTPVPSERHVVVSIPPGNTKPVAVLDKACAANVCTFDAKSSTDENAPTLTYAWSFGNGSTGTGPNPKKTYTAAGTFTVTLTAKDEWGALSDPVTTTVTIAEPAGNAAPQPVIQEPSCSGLACNFSAVGTTDPDTGDAVTYAWSFADTANNAATGAATSHTFTTPGTYLVTLTATDGWGSAATTTRSVTVTSP